MRMIVQQSTLLLASVSPTILKSCAEGSVSQDYVNRTHPLRACLDSNPAYRQRDVIYINLLVDGVGMSPSVAQL